MAHGASTTDECPLEGCGGIIQGYWSEHEREDGTVCPFGPDHPDWEAWNESGITCEWCGEPGDRPGHPLEFDNDHGTYAHRGCWDNCDIGRQPLSQGEWQHYDEGYRFPAHTSCFEAKYES
jgi:hypothetical protein